MGCVLSEASYNAPRKQYSFLQLDRVVPVRSNLHILSQEEGDEAHDDSVRERHGRCVSPEKLQELL